jgi:uracil-DNA glycosylase family 4
MSNPTHTEVTPDEDGDLRTAVAEVRRCLEDLVTFEGRWFVVPDEAQLPTAPGVDVMPAPPTEAEAGDPGLSAADLDSFHAQIRECQRCGLGATRTNFVFGSGNPDAGILFVGEAPGQEEDRQGLPFVGAAGDLLTKIIEAMKLTRDDVYICNVLKCRPPNNRDPQPDEVASCEPYLQKQIDLVQPKVICCLGRHAAHALLKTDQSLSRLRGRAHEYRGIPLIVTYHPAALLRNDQYKRPTWEDVKEVRRLYDGMTL